MTKLLLVRHGITEMNSSRRFSGHTDVDLSEEGFRQVEKLRQRLAKEQIDAVYSSDLKRAMSTAEVISRGHETEISSCFELREIHYGDIEGLNFDEISRQHPEVAKGLTNFSLELSFPGGEDFKGYTARVCSFRDKLENHAEKHTVLITAHGGPLRTLICDLLDISQDNWRKFRFDNASLTIVDIYSRGPILSLLNDTSHLAEEG
ncbi:MAG: histidine phosphatase family protein [Dehalococcoidales bacterium]